MNCCRRRPGHLALPLVMLIAWPLAGCGPRDPGSTMLVERLYFGLATPDGTVSSEDFAHFLAQSVTPRFPDGLTEYRAHGQWRNATGTIIAEETMVVEIAMDDSAANQAKVKVIISDYKTRFRQESVMLVEERSHVEF